MERGQDAQPSRSLAGPFAGSPTSEDMRWWEAFMHVRRDTTAGMHAHTDEDVGGVNGAEGLCGESLTWPFFERQRMLEARSDWTSELPRLPGRLGEERVDGEKS